MISCLLFVFCLGVPEDTGTDVSCVIASLVQLQLDPEYSTIDGFQMLIDKEWVSMGHPFQKRLRLVYTHDSKDSDQVNIIIVIVLAQSTVYL